MIKTVWEGKYPYAQSWVEIDDEAWRQAKFTDYINGHEVPGYF